MGKFLILSDGKFRKARYIFDFIVKIIESFGIKTEPKYGGDFCRLEIGNVILKVHPFFADGEWKTNMDKFKDYIIIKV